MKIIMRRKKKKKVLIVDDEVAFTELVKMNLEATGKYEVRTENKGSLALLAAKQFRPDLILLDIIMPDKGGGEVSGQLEGNEDTKNIPIVYLTAIVTKEEAAARDDIISGHQVIPKPVSTEELVKVIEMTTGKNPNLGRPIDDNHYHD